MDIPEIVPPDTEPGMNFISVDFDLIMVNRANERLYGKPVTALLGKKCYREFERRDEPCPHCPGRLTLATGETHETETMGTRDNGTRFFARIRTHPVMGPDNQPTGFIEVVEDITEQKLAESLSDIETDLQIALLSAKSVQRAVRAALEAALRLQGIDWGCVFMADPASGEPSLVFHRGVSPEQLEMLGAIAREEPGAQLTDAGGAPAAVEVVPILHRSDRIATILVGTSTGLGISPTPRAGLRSLGAITGNAISRIRAEQSRGDAVADLEAVVMIAPAATWVLDRAGRITMWNRAAERLLGWQAAEVIGQPQPFGAAHLDPVPDVLTRKDGRTVEVRLFIAPFRDVVGNQSATIVMAEDLSQQKRLEYLEARLAAAEAGPESRAGPRTSADATGSTAPAARVLIIDSGELWGQELLDILSHLGYAPTRCASIDEAAVILRDVKAEDHPFILTVVDLVTPTGSSGLAQKAALRDLGLRAPVVVSCDADVRGYEQYDIAGAIKRPYDIEAVGKAIREALS